MKKFILAIIAIFVCSMAISQNRIVIVDGQRYEVGASCRILIPEVYTSRAVRSDVLVPTFRDRTSLEKYMRGQDLIAGGISTMVISGLACFGCQFVPEEKVRIGLTYGCAAVGAIGGICSLVGLYQTHRWRFNGEGLVYTF